MWNIKDYENFISFLNQEGVNIEEYKQEFSEIVDKLNDIYYRIDPYKTRFKFSKTYNIFGFDVIGLLNSTCGSTRYYNHNDLKLVLYESPESGLGFRVRDIPFEKRFADSLHEIFMKEMTNNYANYN